MNLLLLEPDEIDDGGRVALPADDRRAVHVRRVLRAQVGDTLRVGVVRGASGRATVAALAADGVTLDVTLDGPAPTAPSLSLALALPRPKALTRVLAAAASFGVRDIALLNAWRVDKSYWSSPRLAEAHVDGALRDGCEQGQHTWLPDVQRERLLMPYLARVGAERAGELRLLAHPGAQAIERVAGGRAAGADGGGAARTRIAIGPEGGWIADEVSAFERAGFVAVSLGTPTLRSHDAVVAALAQLALLARL